ncbi:MAG: lipopolysaccharide assembly protein LapA domain-containing protein [Candidatus Eiseniibacteriota bacterium]
MWLLKNAGWLLIFAVAGWFGFENRNETVSNLHLAGRSYPQSPLVLAVFVTFCLGMFAAFVLTLFQQLKTRSAMTRVNRENQDLKRELSQLRNMPLDDLRLGAEAHR